MKSLARIAAIILVRALSLGLAACSAAKLGYGALPHLARLQAASAQAR